MYKPSMGRLCAFEKVGIHLSVLWRMLALSIFHDFPASIKFIGSDVSSYVSQSWTYGELAIFVPPWLRLVR